MSRQPFNEQQPFNLLDQESIDIASVLDWENGVTDQGINIIAYAKQCIIWLLQNREMETAKLTIIQFADLIEEIELGDLKDVTLCAKADEYSGFTISKLS